MKDLGNGFGTFIKLQSECLLKDNSLINIGDSYIVCTLGVEEDTHHSEYQSDYNIKNQNKDKDCMLNIKIFSGSPKYDPMYIYLIILRNFQPSKSIIKIGRSSDCEVTVEDNMLSRVHCSIEYREDAGWIVRDGFYSKNKDGSYDTKSSTNGTWYN